MCQLLYKYTNTVIISFLDIYKNIFNKFNELSDEDVYLLADNLGRIAKNIIWKLKHVVKSII